MAKCEYSGCDRPVLCRGFCTKHYQSLRRSGELPLYRHEPHWEIQDDGCWIWTRKVRSDGYGVKSTGKATSIRAHRWTYEAYIGPIPEGLELDHLCNVRACVNPEHLEPVTREVNMARQWERRRSADGSEGRTEGSHLR